MIIWSNAHKSLKRRSIELTSKTEILALQGLALNSKVQRLHFAVQPLHFSN